MKVKSLSRVRPSATPWTAAYQAPPSMGFSRQEYWSGVPLPSPKYTLPQRIESRGSNGHLNADIQSILYNRQEVRAAQGPLSVLNVLVAQTVASVHGILQARILENTGCHSLL